jgi:hypothetical protein
VRAGHCCGSDSCPSQNAPALQFRHSPRSVGFKVPRKRNWPSKQYCGENWICLQQTRAYGDFVRTAECRRAFALFPPLALFGEDVVQLSRQRAGEVIEAESPAHHTAHLQCTACRGAGRVQQAAVPAPRIGRTGRTVWSHCRAPSGQHLERSYCSASCTQARGAARLTRPLPAACDRTGYRGVRKQYHLPP